MKKHAGFGWLILCLAIFFSPVASASKPPLMLGVFPRQNVAETMSMFGPLADYLSRKLGIEVRLETRKDFPTFWKDVSEQRYDIVHFNQLHYIQSHEEYGYQAILMNEEHGIPTVAGSIVVRKDRGIHRLPDLKGKKIIFGGDKTALVSYVMVKEILRDAGFHDGDYLEDFAKNPPNALLGVYYKQADAAGVGDVVIKFPTIVKQIDTSELMTLAVSKPIAHLPWAAKKTLTLELRNRIQMIMKNMKNDDEGRRILKGANLTGLASANDADYDQIRKILRQADTKP